jgi:ankyrin repeat protein
LKESENPFNYTEHINNNDFENFKKIHSESIEIKSKALMTAAEFGRTQMVSFLLSYPKVDTTLINNYAFRRAVRNNHIDTAIVLLNDKRVDPSDANDYALIVAINNDSLDFIRLLLKEKSVNPAIRSNELITLAYQANKLELVKLLWTHQYVKDTLENDDKELYDIVIKIDTQEKIQGF